MALSYDQKIEFLKIIIGVLFSIVGALWTYTTYTETQRNNELKTMINLGDSIAGMHVTCKSDFKGLADLAKENNNSRKGRCYAYFQNAHKRSLSAMITVRKPAFTSLNTWETLWKNLQKEIANAGSEKYDYNSIEDAWAAILVAKGLK